MQKRSVSPSGICNPRVLVAFALCSVGALLAMLSFAATPPNGIIPSETNSPDDSRFVDNPAGRLSGNATAAAPGMPLAPEQAASDWSIVASPSATSPQNNIFSGVTCLSASDCWAVGYAGGNPKSLTAHWDGSSWTVVPSPNVGLYDSPLNSITCLSSSDCWAVGYSGTIGFNTLHTLIEQWDGTSWTIIPSPNTSAMLDNVLQAVTCVSATDC